MYYQYIRRFFLSVRATNRINRGEDADAVLAEIEPMLQSTDGAA
jgi:hypothetical protein